MIVVRHDSLKISDVDLGIQCSSFVLVCLLGVKCALSLGAFDFAELPRTASSRSEVDRC